VYYIQIYKVQDFYTFVCNTFNLHDNEVERSPNLELYTFVCNTHNLHDIEVESSPNLED
jgi:hypothetical protein